MSSQAEPSAAGAVFSPPGRRADELLAALAVVLYRYTDRPLCRLQYTAPDGRPVSVILDLAGDPSFEALTRQATVALQTGGAQENGSAGGSNAQTGSSADTESLLDGIVDRSGVRVLLDGVPVDGLFAGHLETVLSAAAHAPEQPVESLSILTEAERHRLLVTWNDTQASYPARCLHELISEQAARTPEKIAVQFAQDALTYRELEARANRLANHLVAMGVGRETLVGICVERGVEMLVGLLGIVKAGGAYVPVDPTYPAERQQFMLSNSQAPVVITQERLLGDLPVQDVQVLCLDRDWPAIAQRPASPPDVAADPEQLAYVIYTSGSTGQPKGVQIPHRALVNFLTTMRSRPGLSPDDVLVAVTTLSFDIAGLELYLPLTTGARLVVSPAQTAADPKALAELLDRSGATVMQATPTTWRLLLDGGWTPPRPLKALCGGEALPVALAGRLLEAGLELWNMYGPTETTIWSTCTELRSTDAGLTVGRPIANTTLYVLDKRMQPVAVGVAGELWIGGDGLARGYRGRQDLTDERFVPHPFDLTPGARIYRTGDLVRHRRGGEVEFLGRIDHQVKVRGYRIELGEIETVLSRHPGVGEAVVVAHATSGAESELAAYVVPVGAPVPAHELRGFAAGKLPPYMVPLTVTTLERFPLTPNGKVDRQALPEPARERSSAHQAVAPRTELEARLQSIWERELGIRPIGVTDNFFELGVTSIVAATLFAAIEHELSSSLPLGAIFQAPTIEGLAGLLERGSSAPRWTSLIPIQPRGSQPPIFCVHGGAGTILHLRRLSNDLGPDHPFYGLQSRGLYGGSPPLGTVEEMATHYLSEMRQVHPGGPWRLAGYCFGVLVAFEIALRLTAAGEPVELLASFNGPSAAWIRKYGWYGNQPSWRARQGMAPPRSPARRRVRRGVLAVRRAVSLLARVPRLVAQPRRVLSSLDWYTRDVQTRIRMRLGRPVSERHREIYFLDLHAAAERAFHPAPYAGEMLVFYGQDLYEDPTLGWEDLARGGIRSFAAPGVHRGNRALMAEPAVGFVAERLAEYLSAAGSGHD